MIRVETGEVVGIVASSPRRVDLEVRLAEGMARAIAYLDLCPAPRIGDRVLCNTTAVALGLGTGGVHFVIAVLDRDVMPPATGHAMKLRYSPLQIAVDAIEEGDASADGDLAGIPIVTLPVHSLLAPVAIAAAQTGARVVYVMTDQAALPIAFSDLVARLRAEGLLAGTVTTGQAFGGDLEAVTVASGMLAARTTLNADLIVVGMGPGNLGTGSRYGFAALEVASILQFAIGLGGAPVVAPRLSFADPRPRHRGLSHHLRTALRFAPTGWRLALPALPAERRAEIAFGAIPAGAVVAVDTDRVESALADSELLHSMGRGFADDPWFFRAGAAASLAALGSV